MRPSRLLKIYYVVTFIIGLALTILVAYVVKTSDDLGARGAPIMTLCWNCLFIMLLPLVLDWGERRYFKARFLELEEVAKTNPELAAFITEQCKKLSIPGFRFAVVDTKTEPFSYGLWRHNPRLVVPDTLLVKEPESAEDLKKVIPSIEAELTRFATQDHTFLFICYAIVQVILQQLIIAFH